MRRVIWILVGFAVIVVLVLMFTAPSGMPPLHFVPAGNASG